LLVVEGHPLKKKIVLSVRASYRNIYDVSACMYVFCAHTHTYKSAQYHNLTYECTKAEDDHDLNLHSAHICAHDKFSEASGMIIKSHPISRTQSCLALSCTCAYTITIVQSVSGVKDTTITCKHDGKVIVTAGWSLWFGPWNPFYVSRACVYTVEGTKSERVYFLSMAQLVLSV
jgi:hypothetical protein